jgi:integrase/recombinase XerD
VTKVNWRIRDRNDAIGMAVHRYRRHLENIGLRPSTIKGYAGYLSVYLKFAGTDRPSEKFLHEFRETLFDRHLAHSTLNNYKYAITAYQKMLDEKVEIPFLSRSDSITYYFSEDEITRLFEVIMNLKHLCMFQVLFFGCLRAGELCDLDDADLDLKSLTLQIRQGKGGRSGLVYPTEKCARNLKAYLEVRPPLTVEGRKPLFFTDFGKRWSQGSLYRIFGYYKEKAGIEKKGALHVFARHSSATLMTSKGVPLNIVQTLLRHKDVRSTLRYAHVDSTIARQWYNKIMKLDF